MHVILTPDGWPDSAGSRQNGEVQASKPAVATLVAQEGIKILIVDVPAASQVDVYLYNVASLLSKLVLFATSDPSEALCLAGSKGMLIYVERVPVVDPDKGLAGHVHLMTTASCNTKTAATQVFKPCREHC